MMVAVAAAAGVSTVCPMNNIKFSNFEFRGIRIGILISLVGIDQQIFFSLHQMLVRLFVFLFVSVLSPFLWVSTPITPIKSIFAPSSIPSMQITVHRLNCSHQTFISQEQETFLSLSFASLQYGITLNHTWLLRTNISKQMKTSGQLFFFNKYLYFFRFSVFKKIDWKASEIFSYFEHQMVTLLLWSGLMDVEFCSSSVLLMLMRASLCRVYLSRMIFVYFWRCSEVNFFPCWICGIWVVLFFSVVASCSRWKFI